MVRIFEWKHNKPLHRSILHIVPNKSKAYIDFWYLFCGFLRVPLLNLAQHLKKHYAISTYPTNLKAHCPSCSWVSCLIKMNCLWVQNHISFIYQGYHCLVYIYLNFMISNAIIGYNWSWWHYITNIFSCLYVILYSRSNDLQAL